MTHVVGYARTSTADQAAGLNAQVRDLEAAGATKIFREQLSGKTRERPQLDAALDYLRDGDTFMATKLDRVARSAKDSLDIVARVRACGATFRVLTPAALVLGPGDTQDAIPKAMLTIFAAIAEMEVDLMRERQREGIREAQAAGAYIGRKPTAQEKAQALLDAVAGGMEPSKAAKAVEISRASAFRILKAEKAAQALREAVRQAGEKGADLEEAAKAAAKAAGVTWGAAKRVLGPLSTPQKKVHLP